MAFPANRPTSNWCFIPFQSAEARRLCPELPRFQPNEQLIVLSNKGGIYAGESAWLMCLYALRDYRGWAPEIVHPGPAPARAPDLHHRFASSSDAIKSSPFSTKLRIFQIMNPTKSRPTE